MSSQPDERPGQSQRQQPDARQRVVWLDLLQWCLLLVALGGVGASFAETAWGRSLPPWVVPLLLGAGILCAVIGRSVAAWAARLRRDAQMLRLAHAGQHIPLAVRELPLGPSPVGGLLASLDPAIILPIWFSAGLLGAVIAGLAGGEGFADAGLIAFGVAVSIVAAVLPWLSFDVSAWVAVLVALLVPLLLWHDAAGWSPWRMAWLFASLCAACLLAVSGYLRRLALHWVHARMVVRPGMVRATLVRAGLCALVLALAAALPLGAITPAPVHPALPGWLVHVSSTYVASTPQVSLGSTLPLSAPGVRGDTVLFRYVVEQQPAGDPVPPQLVGVALDTYSNGQWMAGATQTTNLKVYSPAPDVPLLQVRVTLADLPPTGGVLTLPTAESTVSVMPVAGDVGPQMYPGALQSGASGAPPWAASPCLLSGLPVSAGTSGGAGPDSGVLDAPTATLAVAGWQAIGRYGTAQPGRSYEITALLPDAAALAHLSATASTTPGAYGWTPGVLARLTAAPAALAPALHDAATAWLAAGARDMGSTPAAAGSAASLPAVSDLSYVAQAQAIAAGMRHTMTVDGAHAEPAGDAAIADFLTTRRGTELVFVTTFILALRTLGIPVRLAEAFTSTDFDIATGAHLVHAADYTHLAELAVPGSGWFGIAPMATPVPVTRYTGVSPAATPQSGTGATPPTPTPRLQRPVVTPTPQVAQHDEQQRDSHSLHSALTGLGLVLLALAVLVFLLALVVGLLLALLRGMQARRAARGVPFRMLVDTLRGMDDRAWLAGVALHRGDTPANAMARVLAALPAEESAPIRAAAQSLVDAYVALRLVQADTEPGGGDRITAVSWQDLVAVETVINRVFGREVLRHPVRSLRRAARARQLDRSATTRARYMPTVRAPGTGAWSARRLHAEAASERGGGGRHARQRLPHAGNRALRREAMPRRGGMAGG